MIEDELIKIWQSSPKVEQVKFEKSRLMLELQSSLDRFHKLVKRGIIIEQVAILIAIPVFLFYIYFVPHLLSKIASFLIVIWSSWYLTLLRRMKKAKPDSITWGYMEYLKENRKYMYYLRKWTKTVMYWYVSPSLFGYFLFIAGPYVDGAIDNTLLFKLTLPAIVTIILVYFRMRWILKKIYAPRLKKIDQLIQVMEED